MRSFLIASFSLIIIFHVSGQSPVDSMPIAKPIQMDSSMVVKPEKVNESMPVAKPDQLPPQQEQSSVQRNNLTPRKKLKSRTK